MGCEDRESFTVPFVASWNASWGSNHFSAVVEDRLTGCVYVFGDPGAAFPLASVAKVLIMAGILEGVQDGRWSLASVSGPLNRMIHVSDNSAAQALWNQLGGGPAIDVLAGRWGMSGTHSLAGRGFGGTLSPAADQVHLVKALIGTDPSPLIDARLRLHARSLMTSVDPSQAWGVSAGVPAGWTTGLKNGWYPTGPGDFGPAGRWRVNSVGMVWDGAGAERWAIAVLGNTWPTFATGIAAIESIAAQVSATLSAATESVAVPWTPVPPVLSGAAGALVTIEATRVLDTRTDGSMLPAASTRTIDLSGHVGGDATVAVTHLTADGAVGAGFLTAFACDHALPLASNVNYTPEAPASNDAIVELRSGQVCVYSSNTTDLIVDVAGFYSPSGALRYVAASTPMRLLDTRETSPVMPAGSITTITAPSLDGAPAVAVVVNVTADGATSPGYLVAYPSDQSQPATSSVNFRSSQTIAVATTVATTDGRFSIYNSAPVAIIVDLVGVFTEGAGGRLYQPAVPQRMLDTRSGTGGWLGALGAGQTITVPLAVAAYTTAVGTLTATDTNVPGYVTTWAGDSPRPATSNLNVAPGETIANLTMTRTAIDGTIAIYSQSGRHHLVFDLWGWYA